MGDLMEEEDHEHGGSRSFSSKVEELCLLFDDLKELPLLKEFMAARAAQHGEDHVRVETNPRCVSERLALYEAWCFVFREAVMEGESSLAVRLLRWVESFHARYPPAGVSGAVEQVRLFLTLRSGLRDSEVATQAMDAAVEMMSRQSLGPLLPFMQTRIETDKLESMLERVFKRSSPPLFPEEAMSPRLKEIELVEGELEEEEKEEDISSDETDESESESEDEDGAEGFARAALLRLRDDEKLLEAVSGGRKLPKAGRARRRRKRPLRVGSGDGEYASMGTSETTQALRLLAGEEAGATFGSFDKAVITALFKARTSRAEACVAFMTYLAELESNSSRVKDLHGKFRSTMGMLLRQSRSHPPSLGVAQGVYVAAVKLATVSNEFDYDRELRIMFMGLVDETKRVMDIAFESTRVMAAQTMSMASARQGADSSFHNSGRGSMLLAQLSTQDMLLGPRLSMIGAPMGNAKRGDSIGAPEGDEDGDKPTARTYDGDFFLNAPPNTVVAHIPEVWLQIDPDVDSVNHNNPDLVGDEEMTSLFPGTLRLYKNRITWVLTKPKGVDLDDVDPLETSSTSSSHVFSRDEMARRKLDAVTKAAGGQRIAVYDAVHNDMGISNEQLSRYAADLVRSSGDERQQVESYSDGRLEELTKPVSRQFHRNIDAATACKGRGSSSIKEDKQDFLGGDFGMSLGGLDDIGGRPLGEEEEEQLDEVPDSLLSVPINQVRRYTWGELDHANTYLALYTNEVIKLFPFSRVEITEILKALHDVTGIKPTTLGSHCETGFRQKLEDVRLKILDEQILQTKSKWITHTEELLRVLKELTKDDAPVKMVEMERLYHSCRNNKAVIYESISILKDLWSEAKTQDTMMKILAIVDRFLESNILNGDDNILADTLKWLHTIETGLDPYSNATALKLLLRVCHRAESLQSQTIAPLVEVFYDNTLFDLKESFTRYLTKHR